MCYRAVGKSGQATICKCSGPNHEITNFPSRQTIPRFCQLASTPICRLVLHFFAWLAKCAIQQICQMADLQICTFRLVRWPTLSKLALLGTSGRLWWRLRMIPCENPWRTLLGVLFLTGPGRRPPFLSLLGAWAFNGPLNMPLPPSSALCVRRARLLLGFWGILLGPPFTCPVPSLPWPMQRVNPNGPPSGTLMSRSVSARSPIPSTKPHMRIFSVGPRTLVQRPWLSLRLSDMLATG